MSVDKKATLRLGVQERRPSPRRPSKPVVPASASRDSDAQFEAFRLQSSSTRCMSSLRPQHRHFHNTKNSRNVIGVLCDHCRTQTKHSPWSVSAAEISRLEKYLLFSRLSVRGYCGPFPFSVHCYSLSITHLLDNQGREHSRPWQRQATCQTAIFRTAHYSSSDGPHGPRASS